MPKAQYKNKLEQDSIKKLMLELCTQTTLSIMLYNIYSITDTFYVAKGIGNEASGAIGIFAPFLLLVNGLGTTLGTGGASVVSRKLGAGNLSGVRKVIGCMIWLWILCSLAITAVGLLFIDPLLQLLGCTPQIYPYAVCYGRIMLAGILISTGFSSIMRANGDIVYSTLQWCCPITINLILDPLFLYGFHMGIGGVAAATFLAQMFSAGNSIYYFFIRKKTLCRITPKNIQWDSSACKEILSVGFPAFLNNLGNSFVGIIGNQILGQIGGTPAIGAFTIISRIQSFLSTPFAGIMQGIQPMLGFDWGRGEIKRIRKTVSYALYSGLVYGALISVCVYCMADKIIGIFSSDPEMISIGTSALQTICWSLMIGGIMPVIQACFLSLGQGRKVLLLSLEITFFVRLPLLFAAGFIGSLTVTWWILTLSEWLATGLAIYHNRLIQKGKLSWKV